MRALALGLLVLLAPALGRAETRSDVRELARPVVIERVVAVVDGRPIFLSQVRRTQHVLQTVGAPADPRAALEKRIDDVLLVELCEREGGVTDEHVDAAIQNVFRRSRLTRAQFEAVTRDAGYMMQAYRADVRRQLCLLSAVTRRVSTTRSDWSEHDRARRELTRALRARATIQVRL
jgi:hypothetical protein